MEKSNSNEVIKEVNTRGKAMEFNQEEFARIILTELSSNSSGRSFMKKYTQSDIRDMIENYTVEANQNALIEISKTLYVKSQQYKRLVQYFSDMAIFSYVIKPIRNIQKNSKAKVQKQYNDVGEMVDRMQMKHEMRKLFRVALVEDVYYGYVHEDKSSFYIQKIDREICKITSIEDGVFNFSIDMAFFEQDEKRLENYADEIKNKYSQWKKMKSGNRGEIGNFVELDPENTICIKVNEESVKYITPPFTGVFDSIFDIDAFKQLRKNKEEIGNYMILVQKLPIRSDSNENNDFLIDSPMMTYFHNRASQTVPENVGVITSPMDIEPVRFDKDKADNDGVAKAERDFWAGSGTSQALFSVEKNTTKGIELSIKTDEEMIFALLSQIQRWVNRYIKHKIRDPLFNIEILDLTYFNVDQKFKAYVEAGTLGFPVKSHIGAVLGLSPTALDNMAYLENDVLELNDKLIPLKTSHTQSGSQDEGGRPKLDDGEITDEGDRTRDKE